MNEGPDLDLLELHRQLTDLADSAGPWDDPMPEVRRRAVMTPTPARVPRRWLPASVSPMTLGSAAAAVLVVAGAGWLLHGTGGGDRKTADSGTAARAAGAEHSQAAQGRSATPLSSAAPQPHTASGGPSVPGVTRPRPRPNDPVSCVPGKVSGALVLSAPAVVGTGARVQVSVRSGRGAQGAPPIILVRSGAGVVGRLVPARSVPGAHPAPPRPVNETTSVVAGTLQRVSPVCGRSPATNVPAVTPAALGPLPAGRYQLIAVSYLNSSFVLSAPVTVVVTR